MLLNKTELLEKAREALQSVALSSGPLEQVLQNLLPGKDGHLLRDLEEEEAQRLYAAAANTDASTIKDPEKLVEKQVSRLEKDGLLARSAVLTQAIQEAQRANDHGRMMELVAQKAALDKQSKRWGAA